MSDAVPIKMALADAVRAYGIRAACRESGVPRPTVMRWLRGGGEITLAQAWSLAREVGRSFVICWSESAIRRAAETCLAKPPSEPDATIAREILENFAAGATAADIAASDRWFNTPPLLDDFIARHR